MEKQNKMDELDELPTIMEQDECEIVAEQELPAAPAKKQPPRKRKKPAASTTTAKKPKKAVLVKRYLDNFDSSKQPPPSEADLKSMTVAKLETLCTLQQKQATHNMQPSGLAVTLIGFVSQCLDFLAQTDNEITRLNQEDEELKRAVSEELGNLATFLNNKVKIGSHLALNCGRAVVKKRKLGKKNESEEECVEASPVNAP
jgi:hypothetical protein